MKTKHYQFILITALLALALAACGGGGEATAETITVKAQDTFKYDPPTLTAKVGETVNIVLDNEGVLEHNFVITELSVALGPVPGGQTAPGSFTPSQAGAFEYFCDVPGHREAGMVGTLTVNP